MGIIRSGFSFITGTLFGIYVAQNYNLPNISNLANTGLVIFKLMEESYRKPKKSDSNED
ncbi:hypothetical protein HS088_TW20G00224 [Tripterygium wilfordii]|uniref:Uncharacterized protein n=1 Tax=Tripterygium wilfordii TaxID=458696 RepID=A0A7J7C6V1_TRIWF|nr:hypothetical protein HS088_TW20G00224 [Tripterygium wilfordii]